MQVSISPNHVPEARSGSGLLSVRNLTKSYGALTVVSDVSLTVERGKILALLGPSGCGKTTLLKMIAGLTEPSAGEITVDGEPLGGVPTHRRRFGMLFQNYALLPHLNVMSNVAFGLEMQGFPKADIQPRVYSALSRVELSEYANRMPHELSGGQQQRVALARALVYEPRLLLLDEPFAALDKKLRESMQLELRSICNQLELTTILVTHDQDEALTLADEIAVMRDGRIEQIGVSRDIYERPRTPFVADFVGKSNFFPGTVVGRDGSMVSVRTEDGVTLQAECVVPIDANVDTVLAAVRPEAISLLPPGTAPQGNHAVGEIRQVVFRGSTITTILALADNAEFVCSTPAGSLERLPKVGERWVACWPVSRTIAMPQQKPQFPENRTNATA